jgi:hypothetical protein
MFKKIDEKHVFVKATNKEDAPNKHPKSLGEIKPRINFKNPSRTKFP